MMKQYFEKNRLNQKKATKSYGNLGLYFCPVISGITKKRLFINKILGAAIKMRKSERLVQTHDPKPRWIYKKKGFLED